MKISATIIAFNEEKNISAAIKSLEWADEIVVVDSESSDRTRTIAESLGAKVLIQPWLGFGRQKQFAADNAENDWIFSLDADERISKELSEELLHLKKAPENQLADGYLIPRMAFYMKRPIRHGGWYPDWQLRFYNRRLGIWNNAIIHESVKVPNSAKIKKLKNNILHFTVENALHHHRMIGERYAPLSARQMFETGRRTCPLKVAAAGMAAFLKTYILKRGFLDGFPGFCIASFAAYHAFLKHLLLWEMQRKPKP